MAWCHLQGRECLVVAGGVESHRRVGGEAEISPYIHSRLFVASVFIKSVLNGTN